ncbi:MAG: hypothetical protein V1695_03335 [Candidatus Uhrbacteria bacterium]
MPVLEHPISEMVLVRICSNAVELPTSSARPDWQRPFTRTDLAKLRVVVEDGQVVYSDAQIALVHKDDLVEFIQDLIRLDQQPGSTKESTSFAVQWVYLQRVAGEVMFRLENDRTDEIGKVPIVGWGDPEKVYDRDKPGIDPLGAFTN